MPNQALSPGDRRVISAEASEIPQNQAFQMQDHPSPSSLENAIALQKYGVGHPVR
jgi:hypothetical protein